MYAWHTKGKLPNRVTARLPVYLERVQELKHLNESALDTVSR